MDWDEPTAGSNQCPVLGEVLDKMSVDDLRARIITLQTEISRVEREIDKRQGHKTLADQIFKS